MAWSWLTLAAKSIPWTALVRRAPEIIEVSSRLLAARKAGQASARTGGPGETRIAELRERISKLEARDRDSAALVEQMAEQIRDLTSGAQVLAARVRLLLVIVAALGALIGVGLLAALLANR